MKIRKITNGFVSQEYDTTLKKWVGQEFIAFPFFAWENDDGENVEFDDVLDLPFSMSQPINPEIGKTNVVYFFNGKCWLEIIADSDWCENVLSAFSPLKNGNCIASKTLIELYENLRRADGKTFNPENVSCKDFTENLITINFDLMVFYQHSDVNRDRPFLKNDDVSKLDIVIQFDYITNF